MQSSVNSSICFYLNPYLFPYFIRISWATSYSIFELLHPPTLQPNTRLSNIPHISSRISKMPHPATNLSKMSNLFTSNITTKTIQAGYSFLPVTSPQLTLHNCNSLFIPLPCPWPVTCFQILGRWTHPVQYYWHHAWQKFRWNVLQNSWFL